MRTKFNQKKLNCAKFFMKYFSALKYFWFQRKKRKLPFKNLIPVPNFDIMGKNMYSAYTYNLKTSKFV